jgi:nucleoside-diphosphate-sugar epimerase
MQIMRVLIVGCGYVGTALAQRLVEMGHQVCGVRRDPAAAADLKAVGIQPVIVDITRSEDLAKVPASFDWVVNTVSSSGGGLEEYQKVYFEGTKNLLAWLQSSPPKNLFTQAALAFTGKQMDPP